MDSSIGNTEKAVISQPYSGSCNSDGYAVQWCIDRLDTRKEKAKLLFVISDGQPSGPSPSCGAGAHLKRVTRGCPSDIGLVGIGIAGMDCSEYYPTNVSVRNTTNLANEMLPILRDMLRKVVRR
jgi:cobalamin biosynthesis protein CobT